MTTNDSGTVYERSLEIAVEARTLARQGHERQDASESRLKRIEESMAGLAVSVAQLNTKVAVAATIGSVLGGAIVAGIVSLIINVH
jgi:hypothetical protein